MTLLNQKHSWKLKLGWLQHNSTSLRGRHKISAVYKTWPPFLQYFFRCEIIFSSQIFGQRHWPLSHRIPGLRLQQNWRTSEYQNWPNLATMARISQAIKFHISSIFQNVSHILSFCNFWSGMHPIFYNNDCNANLWPEEQTQTSKQSAL